MLIDYDFIYKSTPHNKMAYIQIKKNFVCQMKIFILKKTLKLNFWKNEKYVEKYAACMSIRLQHQKMIFRKNHQVHMILHLFNKPNPPSTQNP